MPLELGIWRLGESPEKVTFSIIDSEQKLEDILVKDITIISPGLMFIGRQVRTDQGNKIDLLAMDADGNLVVIELKKSHIYRDAITQLLDYGSWIQSLDYERIAEIYSEKNEKALEEGFAESFDASPPDEINKDHKLVLVATELDNNSERIIDYLSETYGIPINAVFFRYFREGSNEYLTRNWLIDPQEVESNISKSATKKHRETWNGNDFYVAFGDDVNRNWDDAKKYGFVSAGGGRWYTRALETLSPGNRVFVYVPGIGYVGVGIVIETVKPIDLYPMKRTRISCCICLKYLGCDVAQV